MLSKLTKKNDAALATRPDSWMVQFPQLRWGMDRLLSDFLGDFPAPLAEAPGIALEVTETEKDIRVKAEVPGIAPDDLDVNLSGDVLTISGEKLEQQESEEQGRKYTERRFGSFQRSIELPCPVDPDRVEAKHEHGVVTIVLTKAEVARTKHIPISG